MKPKLILCLALVLSGGLFVCHIAWQHHVQSFLERLRPPSADQIKKWAGFPERTHLTMLTNVPDDLKYDNNNDDDNPFGKSKWFWIYEDRKGTNFTRVVIAVFEPGGFWPTMRGLLINVSKQNYKRYSEEKHLDKENPIAKQRKDMEREMSPMTMPNGKKSYGFLFGLSPGRFASHPEFDVVACEYAEPMSYDERYSPADLTAMPTNSFSEFFTNVDAFLTSQ